MVYSARISANYGQSFYWFWAKVQLRRTIEQTREKIPKGTDYVWFRTKIRELNYTYEYSFDGENWKEVPVVLDAAILSDDYVLQHYGGFFTGAFVGLAAVDYSGYKQSAVFDFFDYQELD